MAGLHNPVFCYFVLVVCIPLPVLGKITLSVRGVTMYAENTAIIFLLAVLILAYLGLLERVLERMHLNRTQALVILLALVLGSGLPPISLVAGLKINVGGMLIPAGVCVYLLVKADTAVEKGRVLLATLITTGIMASVERLLPLERGALFFDLDALYFPAIVAGLTAYLLGRSRRASFIAGILSILLLDLIAWIENTIRGLAGAAVELGGGGVFGGAVLAGFFAVLLAEVVGEIRERIWRGAS